MGKTSQERLQALRERRAKAGLKRFDIYVHPKDWPTIQLLVKKLAKWRNAK